MKKKRVAAKAKTSKATPEAAGSSTGQGGEVDDRCEVLTSFFKVGGLEGQDPDLIDLKENIRFLKPRCTKRDWQIEILCEIV